jgi:hypothetical protein
MQRLVVPTGPRLSCEGRFEAIDGYVDALLADPSTAAQIGPAVDAQELTGRLPQTTQGSGRHG